MITQDRMEKALTYLAETDEPCAMLRADYERAKWKAKAIFDAAVARLPGSVAERQGVASELREYIESKEHEFALLLALEKMRNKRATEEIVFEAWRSLNKNRG